MNAEQYTDDDGNLWIKTGRVFENQFWEYICDKASVWVSNPAALSWVPVEDTSKFAIYSEFFKFRTGPQKLRFYLCEKHVTKIPHEDCFCRFPLATDAQPRVEDPLCEYPCDICRGEDGP